MKPLLLGALLLLAPGPAHADPVTPTVQVAGITISASCYIFTPGKGYVHLLLDTFALRGQLGDAAKRKALALGLLNEKLDPKFSAIKKAKVDVVEFTERDSYGAPDWGSLVKLEHYEGIRVRMRGWRLETKP